jgi:hypothetical protein
MILARQNHEPTAGIFDHRRFAGREKGHIS